MQRGSTIQKRLVKVIRQTCIHIGGSLTPEGTRSKYEPVIHLIQTYNENSRNTIPMAAHTYMPLNEKRGWIRGDSASLFDRFRLGQKKYTARITKTARIDQVHQDILSLLIQYLYKILRFNWLSIVNANPYVNRLFSTFLYF